jgi:single-stranded-DNA-specific exonuclease
VDVVILDHHQSKTELPDGAVIVNPHLFDEEGAPWRDLCTVGLVFKFVHALLKQLRAEGDDLALHVDLKSYLDLVALGTVADLVPLTGENRVLTRKGLELLRVTRRAGLGALFEVSGMALGSPVTPFDIAFRLSPRINACGRLADASAPIELLMSDDWTQCRQVARQLDDFNNQRQAIERGITEQAEALVETQYAGRSALVLAGEGWHPGVVGIVAARIAGKYHRPTLVFGSEGTLLKGSGRSVPASRSWRRSPRARRCWRAGAGTRWPSASASPPRASTRSARPSAIQ